MCSGSEAGSCLRLIDSCIIQLEAQGPSRACYEREEEEESPDVVSPACFEATWIMLPNEIDLAS